MCLPKRRQRFFCAHHRLCGAREEVGRKWAGRCRGASGCGLTEILVKDFEELDTVVDVLNSYRLTDRVHTERRDANIDRADAGQCGNGRTYRRSAWAILILPHINIKNCG